ncbi:MAG: hypothetical protein ABL308_06835 [Oceanicaulis sp.]
MRDGRSPAAFTTFVALMAAAAAGPASAQAEPPGAAGLDPLFACRDIAAPDARLACFDQAVAALDQRRESLVVVDRAEIEAVERDSFGFSLPSVGALSSLFSRDGADHAGLSAGETGSADAGGVTVLERGGDGQVDAVEVAVDRVRTVGYDTQRFYLANGQVWELLEGVDRNRLFVRDDSTVIIRRAALGSYMLQVDGRGAARRARRVE